MYGRRFQIKMFAYHFEDIIDGNRFCFVMNHAMYNVLCQIQIYFFVENSGTSHDSNDDTFQIAYTFIHIFGNIIDHFRRELCGVALGI